MELRRGIYTYIWDGGGVVLLQRLPLGRPFERTMPLLHSNGGLFLRAIKHGLNEVQNQLHHEPQHAFEDRRPEAQFKIIIYVSTHLKTS